MSKKIVDIKTDEYEILVNRIDEGDKYNAALVKFREESRVKLIIFNEKYKFLSFDKNIDCIRKLRSVYRGNTYVIKPIKISGENQYTYQFNMVENEFGCDGYAVISKREVRESEPQLLRAKASEIETICNEKILSTIDAYCKLLSGNVFDVTIKRGETTYTATIIENTPQDLMKAILFDLPFLDDSFDKEITNAFKNLKW